MTHDRDYYRARPTAALIEETTYGIAVDYKELAIALAERLRKKCDELDRVKSDLTDARYCYD